MSMGDSFVSGFSAITDAKKAKKQLELEAADQALRREMQQKQMDNDIFKMKSGFQHDADMAKTNHDWQTSERLGTQAYGTNERVGSQQFSADQADKNRTFQGQQADKNRFLTQQEIDNKIHTDLAGLQQSSRRLDMEEPLMTAQANYYNNGGPRAAGLGGLLQTGAHEFGKSLAGQGAMGAGFNAGQKLAKPPQAAIDALRSNPGLKAQFESKYGAGSASQYSQ